MPTAATSFTGTGVALQTTSGALEQGTYTQVRTMGFALTPEGTIISSKAIAEGQNTMGRVDMVAGNGTNPWESGPDEGTFQGAWPIYGALRAPLVAPSNVAFVGSYQVETNVVLSNGLTGTRIIDVAGTDFVTVNGVADFTIRVVGTTDAENQNRYLAVERCFNNGGNDTMEIANGYGEGAALDPAAPDLDTYYGPPLADVTETMTLQLGQSTVQGTTGALQRLSFVQKYGPFTSPRYAAIQDSRINSLTMTIAPGSMVEYNAAFDGGETTPNLQLNPTNPPILGTMAAEDPLVMGVVLAGEAIFDLDGGSASETVITGDVFTVAGAPGVYTILADATASTGVITGATFEPAAPFGGFADDAAITFEHGPAAFSPTEIVPQQTSLARSDGEPGGLRLFGIVTRTSREAVLMDCDGGLGGVTNIEMTIEGNNSRIDDTICISPEDTIVGTLVPTVTVAMNLQEDAVADRPKILSGMGRPTSSGGNKQRCRVDIVHEFENDSATATAPAAVHWHFASGQADAFGWKNGEKDALLSGTMTVQCFTDKNAEGEISSAARHTFYPEIEI